MDILILNTYPSRSSLFRDNGTGNTLVLYRRGESSRSCVIGSRINSHVSRVLLAFCSRGLPYIGKKTTWHSFCSAIVARPHPKGADSRISIEKGNEVARPLCHFFSLWRGTDFDRKWKSCGATSCHLIAKGRCGKNHQFNGLYLNGTMGNSCKFMIKVTK